MNILGDTEEIFSECNGVTEKLDVEMWVSAYLTLSESFIMLTTRFPLEY